MSPAILVSIVFLATQAWAQGFTSADAGAAPAPPGVDAKVEPPSVQLGQRFGLEIAVTHALDQRFELITPAELSDFDVVDVARERTDGPQGATTRFKVTLAAFQLGVLTLPAFVLERASPAGPTTFPVPETQVEVAKSIGDQAEKDGTTLYDIRPPVEVPVRSYRLLVALLVAALVAATAYAVLRYLKRERPVVPMPTKARAPLNVRTLAALDALRTDDLPGRGEWRSFYFRLSEIVRAYLGERYAFEALESTTPELLETLRRLHTPGLPVAALSDFAVASDFARYAKAQPSADECKAALEFAYRLVQATTPSFTEGT